MTIGAYSPFGVDGRIRGSYVYMLLCRDDDGPAYIKIGVSDSPLQRFQHLCCNCGVTPRVFSVVNLRTRKAAFSLERNLLKKYALWKTKGEWIKVEVSDKKQFNEIWQAVFAKHAEKGRPLRWNQLSVATLLAQAKERGRRWQQNYATRGTAYRDFAADSR